MLFRIVCRNEKAEKAEQENVRTHLVNKWRIVNCNRPNKSYRSCRSIHSHTLISSNVVLQQHRNAMKWTQDNVSTPQIIQILRALNRSWCQLMDCSQISVIR